MKKISRRELIRGGALGLASAAGLVAATTAGSSQEPSSDGFYFPEGARLDRISVYEGDWVDSYKIISIDIPFLEDLTFGEVVVVGTNLTNFVLKKYGENPKERTMKEEMHGEPKGDISYGEKKHNLLRDYYNPSLNREGVRVATHIQLDGFSQDGADPILNVYCAYPIADKDKEISRLKMPHPSIVLREWTEFTCLF